MKLFQFQYADWRQYIFLVLFSLYVLWTVYVGLFRAQVLLVSGGWLLLYYIHPAARRFAVAFLPFFLFVIIYDSMRIYPNFRFNPVSIEEIYLFEKAIFGFEYQGNIIIPNEYFQNNPSDFLTILGGLFYGTWVPIPFALMVYFYIKDRNVLARYLTAYLLTNLVGFIIYYIYPAAPPWYVELYPDFRYLPETPGNPAGLTRFDELVGATIFGNLYSQTSSVFAAVPSLHSAYPLIAWLYARKRSRLLSLLLGIHTTGMWFSAVFLRHHYIVDVILGAGITLLVYFALEYSIRRPPARRWMQKYSDYIAAPGSGA